MQPYRVWMIQDLIEKNKRVFKIPVYQRNYDWLSVQCEKLFQDIISAFEKDKKHFLGTIVYIKGVSHSSKLSEDLIIDGQQRVTTIFILLKFLYDKAIELGEVGIQSEIHDYLFNRNCDEINKLKLKPIKADDSQFCMLMLGNIEDMDEKSNILRNYHLFKKLTNQFLSADHLLGDVLEGLKKLEVVEIVLDISQGDDPQTIFESINSTGLDLSLADLIRNYILMSEKDQERLFEDYWVFLEKKLDAENMAEYFVQYLNYKLTDMVTSKIAYEKFKEYFVNNQFTNETMLQELRDYSKIYALFIGKENQYSTIINSMMADFRSLDQSTIYPFFFAIFEDYEDGVINDETLSNILIFMRAYCLKRIVCEVASNSLKGLFKTLYSRLFKDEKSKELYYETIYSFFMSIRTKDRFPNSNDFIQKLKNGDLYHKKKACKFILAKIENHDCNEVIDIQPLTIEHILPQQENSIVWRNEVGENYQHVYEKYLHTLGNLTITGYNSELGTKPFVEKKRIISTHSKANILNRDILSQPAWNEGAINNRANHLSGIVNSIFSYDECSIINKGNDIDNKMTFDDMEAVINTKPVNYSLCGESVNVSSYAEMLSQITITLYNLEPKIFEKLASDNFHLTNTDRIYISFRDSDMRKAKEIGNTGIFIEVNLSAKSILQFIKRIMEEYGFDTDDFYFIVKV